MLSGFLELNIYSDKSISGLCSIVKMWNCFKSRHKYFTRNAYKRVAEGTIWWAGGGKVNAGLLPFQRPALTVTVTTDSRTGQLVQSTKKYHAACLVSPVDSIIQESSHTNKIAPFGLMT